MQDNQNFKNSIILKLKTINTKLSTCKDYNDVDLLRWELLSYIDGTPILTNIFTEIKNKHASLKNDGRYASFINQIHAYIIALLNVHMTQRVACITRSKLVDLPSFEKVELIDNNNYVLASFAEVPEFLYYPSLSVIFPPRNYLQIVLQTQNLTGLSDFYKLFDDTLEAYLLMFSIMYTFEFSAISQDSFNLGVQENDFNAAYLACIIKAVNENLQTKLLQVDRQASKLQTVEETSVLPHAKLNGRLLSIFNELCKDTTLTAQDLATYFSTQKKTIETQLRDLSKKLNGCGGKNAVVNYIKKHSLQNQ